MKKRAKLFTAGISYEEHKKKAKWVFENEVLPDIENAKSSKNGKSNSESITLTPAQKAHLNCQSPI